MAGYYNFTRCSERLHGYKLSLKDEQGVHKKSPRKYRRLKICVFKYYAFALAPKTSTILAPISAGDSTT